MGLEQVAAQYENFYVQAYTVDIDGSTLAAAFLKSIREIEVEEKIDVGARFILKFNDTFDSDANTFEILDNTLFAPGNEVTLKMGYGSSLETLMIGKITVLEPELSSGQAPAVTIEGQDLSYDFLKKQSPAASFVEKTYADIVKEIAGNAGLTPVVDAVATTDPVTVKSSSESYFQFIETLALRTGYEFRIDGKTLYFVQPGASDTEILSLALGKDINSFHSTLKTTKLYTRVEVRGHNPEDPSKPFSGIAKAGDETVRESGKTTGSKVAETVSKEQVKVITNKQVRSNDHALSIANAVLNDASDTLIEGETETVGLPVIRTGVNVELTRLGTRFSGKYYVFETHHIINDKGYRTKFKVRRNAV